MALEYAQRVKLADLEAFLEPLFARFKAQRRGADETFGDFTARVGPDALRAFSAAYVPAGAADLPQVGLSPRAAAALKAAAEKTGKSEAQLASEAICTHLGVV
jgi:hypothetical protein